jgi:hypothetical protein
MNIALKHLRWAWLRLRFTLRAATKETRLTQPTKPHFLRHSATSITKASYMFALTAADPAAIRSAGIDAPAGCVRHEQRAAERHADGERCQHASRHRDLGVDLKRKPRCRYLTCRRRSRERGADDSGTPPASVVVGSVYTFTPTAADTNRDPLTLTIRNRPVWAAFTAATGRLEGTPQADNVGSYTAIEISVSDGQTVVALPPFNIAVTSSVANTAPSITGLPMTEVEAGSEYAFMPTADDADGNDLTFSISGGPSWTVFDTKTGALTGTPGARVNPETSSPR